MSKLMFTVTVNSMTSLSYVNFSFYDDHTFAISRGVPVAGDAKPRRWTWDVEQQSVRGVRSSGELYDLRDEIVDAYKAWLDGKVLSEMLS